MFPPDYYKRISKERIAMLKGYTDEISKGYNELEKYIPRLKSADITAVKSDGDIKIICKNGAYTIYYNRANEFFRGLSTVLEDNGENFEITLKRNLDTCGLMADVSRNAVLNVCGIKKLLRHMSLMGMNTLMLYTEDTYKLEGEPYFGYLRGAYTCEELKECDDYAHDLGIEMFPCIQVLAHMAQFLKWESMGKYRDTADILLADSEEVYALLDKMIKTASAPYRSNKIHIGMDEAFTLGTGNYLNNHSPKPQHEILQNHLNRVMEIINKYGLEPMMWSDTYIRNATGDNDYWSGKPFIRDVKGEIPENMSLCYWDYHHFKTEDYARNMKRHKELTDKVIFCPSVGQHGRVLPNYANAFSATDIGVAAAKKEGIRSVITTCWGDDGNELNLFYSLPVLLLTAEHAFVDEMTDDIMAKRCRACTGISYSDYLIFGKADTIDRNAFGRFYAETGFLAEAKKESEAISENPMYAMLSKFLLLQDPLVSTYDAYSADLKDYPGVFGKIADEIKEIKDDGFLTEYAEKLCRIIDLKGYLGVDIRNSYLKGDKARLQYLAENVLPKIAEQTEELRKIHREQWCTYYKVYGWEVIDIRYGGVIARAESAKSRIEDYLNGKIERLEELEEERLPVRAMSTGSGITQTVFGNAARAQSACK